MENSESKKHHHTREVSFNVYIKKLLAQIHPGMGITGDALATVNNILLIAIQKIMKSVNTLSVNRNVKRQTLDTKVIESAMRLELRDNNSKKTFDDMYSTIHTAVTKYAKSLEEEHEERTSKNSRAGLVIAVSRVEKHMQNFSTFTRKSPGAAVYLTGFVEFLCSEILEGAGGIAADSKKARIKSRDVSVALNSSPYVNFFSNVILGGGVIDGLKK